MMCLMPDGSWQSISPQVDWDRIDRSTDAEIERQEIADLVEDALQLQAVRRWRRGQVMPSFAHQQRLKRLFAAP